MSSIIDVRIYTIMPKLETFYMCTVHLKRMRNIYSEAPSAKTLLRAHAILYTTRLDTITRDTSSRILHIGGKRTLSTEQALYKLCRNDVCACRTGVGMVLGVEFIRGGFPEADVFVCNVLFYTLYQQIFSYQVAEEVGERGCEWRSRIAYLSMINESR